ncbi:MAG: hypothetical protein K0U42_01970 [Actinomycetia bacterium]|nr:hypothetical protein [Actinomycetes bacterium]
MDWKAFAFSRSRGVKATRVSFIESRQNGQSCLVSPLATSPSQIAEDGPPASVVLVVGEKEIPGEVRR